MDKIYLAGLHWIWFTHKKLHRIFKEKQNYREIFNNIDFNYLKNNLFQDKQIETILDRYNNINISLLEKQLNDRSASIVTIYDDNYPNNLKNIFNVPFLFYLRWKIDNSAKISIIGSRKISHYWNKIIEWIIPDLVKYFTTVSGGAAWCDTKAHVETLNNNWKTISVLWTGIDQDYPIWNEKMFTEITEKWWWVISIFPIWEVWNPYNFPVRNEIVAWLSEWILVVEAREKSGSLITVKLWLDMWKDIFTVPWDIFKWGSVWTNNLIKRWEAKMITNSWEILEEYNISNKNKIKNEKIKFADELEEKIYNILLLENLNIDELSKKLKLNISNVSFKLSMMEINSLILKSNWGKYEIK